MRRFRVTWKVYSITFPKGKRYIGVTKYPVEERFKQHCATARNGRKLRMLHAAIRKYGQSSLLLNQLCVCSTEKEAKHAEVIYIAQLNTLRPHGYNSTIGGDGVIDPSGMSEKRRIERMKATMATEEYKAKQRAVQTPLWDEERRAQRAQATAKLWQDPDYRQRTTVAHLRPDIVRPPKQLLSHEEKSDIVKSMWERPGYREHMVRVHKEHGQTLEVRKQNSEKVKRYFADPEVRRRHSERMREVMNRPEVRKRCSEAHLRTA